ncbi:unnamed protein product [Protopolystoma xenopodis]|uniref:Uncharacterized protein n=1 Tax=Protopolystoma xenopodis TaxID=117903 RepID=A0A3S5BU59_9PLAT|nr:unnamed protein product [Protopolystoma xenopodis]
MCRLHRSVSPRPRHVHYDGKEQHFGCLRQLVEQISPPAHCFRPGMRAIYPLQECKFHQTSGSIYHNCRLLYSSLRHDRPRLVDAFPALSDHPEESKCMPSQPPLGPFDIAFRYLQNGRQGFSKSTALTARVALCEEQLKCSAICLLLGPLSPDRPSRGLQAKSDRRRVTKSR